MKKGNYEIPQIDTIETKKAVSMLMDCFTEDNYIAFNGDDIRKDFTCKGLVIKSITQKAHDSLKSMTTRINTDVDRFHQDMEDARLTKGQIEFHQLKIRNNIESESQMKQFYGVLKDCYSEFVGESFKPYVHTGEVPQDTSEKEAEANKLIFNNVLKARS